MQGTRQLSRYKSFATPPQLPRLHGFHSGKSPPLFRVLVQAHVADGDSAVVPQEQVAKSLPAEER
jgi:hypothetical protein